MVVNVATPLSLVFETSEIKPRLAPLLRNSTVPVGTTAVEDVTVAVNVTASPLVDGLTDEISVVVVVAAFTTCVRILEVLAR